MCTVVDAFAQLHAYVEAAETRRLSQGSGNEEARREASLDTYIKGTKSPTRAMQRQAHPNFIEALRRRGDELRAARQERLQRRLAALRNLSSTLSMQPAPQPKRSREGEQQHASGVSPPPPPSSSSPVPPSLPPPPPDDDIGAGDVVDFGFDVASSPPDVSGTRSLVDNSSLRLSEAARIADIMKSHSVATGRLEGYWNTPGVTARQFEQVANVDRVSKGEKPIMYNIRMLPSRWGLTHDVNENTTEFNVTSTSASGEFRAELTFRMRDPRHTVMRVIESENLTIHTASCRAGYLVNVGGGNGGSDVEATSSTTPMTIPVALYSDASQDNSTHFHIVRILIMNAIGARTFEAEVDMRHSRVITFIKSEDAISFFRRDEVDPIKPNVIPLQERNTLIRSIRQRCFSAILEALRDAEAKPFDVLFHGRMYKTVRIQLTHVINDYEERTRMAAIHVKECCFCHQNFTFHHGEQIDLRDDLNGPLIHVFGLDRGARLLSTVDYMHLFDNMLAAVARLIVLVVTQSTTQDKVVDGVRYMYRAKHGQHESHVELASADGQVLDHSMLKEKSAKREATARNTHAWQSFIDRVENGSPNELGLASCLLTRKRKMVERALGLQHIILVLASRDNGAVRAAFGASFNLVYDVLTNLYHVQAMICDCDSPCMIIRIRRALRQLAVDLASLHAMVGIAKPTVSTHIFTSHIPLIIARGGAMRTFAAYACESANRHAKREIRRTNRVNGKTGEEFTFQVISREMMRDSLQTSRRLCLAPQSLPPSSTVHPGISTIAAMKFATTPQAADDGLRKAWEMFVAAGWFPYSDGNESGLEEQIVGFGFRPGVLELHLENASGMQVAVGTVTIESLARGQSRAGKSFMRVVCFSPEETDVYRQHCEVARRHEPNDDGTEFMSCGNAECFPCVQDVELGRSLLYEAHAETRSSYMVPLGFRCGESAGLAPRVVEILGVKLTRTGESWHGVFDIVKPTEFIIISAARVRGCAWGTPLPAAKEGDTTTVYGVLTRFQISLY
jgi:hypothetical protein